MSIWWVVLYLLAFVGLTHLVREFCQELQLRHGRVRGEGVSVLCVVQNQEEKMEAVLQGLIRLLAQQLPRSLWEIVLVDRGSSDATGQICRRFSFRPGIKFLSLAECPDRDPVQAGRLLCDFPTVILLDITTDRSGRQIWANLRQALEPALLMHGKKTREREGRLWNSS